MSVKVLKAEKKIEDARIRTAAVRAIDAKSDEGGIFWMEIFDGDDAAAADVVYMRLLWAFEEGVKWSRKDAALRAKRRRDDV